MHVWRLIKTRYASTAFDGEGARRNGARWNSRGTRAAYASSNPALAILEVLVHMTSGGRFLGYSLIAATLDDAFIETRATSSLPKDWHAWPVPPHVQAIGDAWIQSRSAVAIRLPSAVVPADHNILINPDHPEFKRLHIHSVEPFEFDPRLLD
ncbi:MAG TPA: RES family NAD+ phosphorylase [Gemmatimonadaceae bacterium]|jgi:RES domain-containing protein